MLRAEARGASLKNLCYFIRKNTKLPMGYKIFGFKTMLILKGFKSLLGRGFWVE
jgi:hypothetical protein